METLSNELNNLSEFSSLCEVSKIRKFIASELKNSNLLGLYNTYWLEMETNYLEAGQKLNKNLLETFLIDYLTIQNNGKISKTEDLIVDFIDFYQKASKFQKKEMIIKNIFRYSIYYLRILFAQLKDEDIKSKISTINDLHAQDAYPFLMEVFEDYEFAHINRAMLLEILDTVIGFINERNSKKPSQVALSFAGLSSEINKMLVLKDYMPRFVIDNEDEQTGETINSLVDNFS